MVNKYGIPPKLEEKIRKRDKFCVFCHVELKGDGKQKSTIEHFDNDGALDEEWNLAMCCNSCNASKGTKKLLGWLNSDYCKEKNITKENVAEVTKKYILLLNKAK
jgi:hypothetical protein